MIKNERQYRITKAEIGRFKKAVKKFGVTLIDDADILVRQAQQDGLQSQMHSLQAEVDEYERLKAGVFDPNGLLAVSELPRMIISARIAQGLSQKDLAERIGVQQQQIQRYEATDYASASLSRIREIIDSLDLNLNQKRELSSADLINKLAVRVAETGLDPQFVQRRLLSSPHLPENSSADASGVALVESALSKLGRVFGWSSSQLFGDDSLKMFPAHSAVHFKVATRTNKERTSAYTLYAHYISLLVGQLVRNLPIEPIPDDPLRIQRAVLSRYGKVDLDSLVRYSWDLGVPVIALDDPGAFHGACFREQGRNVIVLKQRTRSEARWAFDLLHELFHGSQEPDNQERSVVESEDSSTDQTSTEEEILASKFAGAVLLSGQGQMLAEACLEQADNNIPLLKNAVQQVAKEHEVSVAVLANYLAFRLGTEHGVDWWGTANNLQPTDRDPWTLVRDILIEKINIDDLSEIDQDIVQQSLTPWEE